MSTDTRYNGWTNYETWLVNLWMDNEQGSQQFWHDAARECWAESGPKHPNPFVADHEGNARILLADRLKDEHEEARPETTGVFADLIGAALAEVNWYEIAQALLDTVKEETADHAD